MLRIEGIVMENIDGRAVILNPEGECIRIRINEPIEAGEYYRGPAKGLMKYPIVAAVILLLTLGTLDFFRVQAYAQVSDSVEVGINRWGRVVSTRALNDEGQQIIEKSHLKGKKVEDAVVELASQTPAQAVLEEYEKYKEFPEQAADKGNKDADLIQKVEENKNQGLVKAIEKGKQDLAQQTEVDKDLKNNLAGNKGHNDENQ